MIDSVAGLAEKKEKPYMNSKDMLVITITHHQKIKREKFDIKRKSLSEAHVHPSGAAVNSYVFS